MSVPANTRHLGLMRVSTAILQQLLNLPVGVQITDMVRDWRDVQSDSVTFKIMGDGLPYVAEGTRIPEVQGVYHSDDGGKTAFVEFQVYKEGTWESVA